MPSPSFSRRGLLKIAAASALAGTAATALPRVAMADQRVLGTVIDYAAGVPSAQAVKNAGHIGAVRYVSARRPGAEWMIGKPVTATETADFAANGLAVASVYQFGKNETADWKQGAAGAAVHAPQAITFHVAAGGPTGVPVYVAIDDNPSREQYDSLIKPYLQAFGIALEKAGLKLGIYGNYNVINWAISDGIGAYFWQHNWGSNGKIHPHAHLHQIRIDKDKVAGIGVDINNVYREDWGQWTPGKAAHTTAPSTPATSTPAASTTQPKQSTPVAVSPNPGQFPDITVNGSSISGEQISQGVKIAQQISSTLN
ncbi:DUF1906 domain-containing protein [Corynebacterium tapiri]|uniref:DUF1906 domain-containing protein n=1 Tax=Corynebacterium tapiri TaxID=1448266 RepID=A0A5C4U7M3_9CORY|nr:DUF1906 domain-containing protein [Corynebacterium tapiri]TNM00400.1 DUF1906 domain-containing protein [Corynebacterium tapiri]